MWKKIGLVALMVLLAVAAIGIGCHAMIVYKGVLGTAYDSASYGDIQVEKTQSLVEGVVAVACALGVVVAGVVAFGKK